MASIILQQMKIWVLPMKLKCIILLFLTLFFAHSVNAAPDTDNRSLPQPYSHSGTVYLPPEPPKYSLPVITKTQKITSTTKATTIQSAVTTEQPIANIPFGDANLETCVLTAANANNWTLASEVKELKCLNQGIANLDGLQKLTSLYFLSLSGNQISDITPLTGLTDLQWLYLDNNQIGDISALSPLVTLRVLQLSTNQISDITPLSGLATLNWLYLSNNNIRDITALSGLQSLKYLLLDRNHISELNALATLTSLKTLFLYNNAISDISALSGLTNLTRLHLSGNQISDLSSLAGLTALEWLLLGGNNISDVTALGAMTNLQLLDLNLNNLSDISPLSPLVALQTLYLGYNNISNINPLANLAQLQTLLLQDNQINDINALGNLVSLKTLYLQYNQISDITVLSNLTNAVIINLFNNEIIACNDLNKLEVTLGTGIVKRPENCIPSVVVDTDGDGVDDDTDVYPNDPNRNGIEWTIKQWGTDGDDITTKMAKDSQGNIFVIGRSSGGSQDPDKPMLLFKYGPDLKLQWLKRFGASTQNFNSYLTDVAVDGNDNIYLTGVAIGSINGSENFGGVDGFLVKYNRHGEIQWSKSYGTSQNDSSRHLYIDNHGIYVEGETHGEMDGNSSYGATDVFVIKFDFNGQQDWTRTIGGTGIDFARGVVTDSAGNIYIAGSAIGQLNGQTTQDRDGFITKFNMQGDNLWTKLFGTESYDDVFNLAIDSLDNLYVSGRYRASVNNIDIYLTKFNTAGTRLWRREIGTSEFESVGDVAIDVNGNLYITGFTAGQFPGQIPKGLQDIFLAKYDSSGNALWLNTIGGTGNDYGYGILLDGAGDVLISAASTGVIDHHTSLGGNDTYFLKYNASEFPADAD